MNVTHRRMAAALAGIAALGLFAVLAAAQQQPQPGAQPRQPGAQPRQPGQDRPGEARGGALDAQWNEVAELHRRIVQAELRQQAGGRPGQPGLAPGADEPRRQPGAQPGGAEAQPGQAGAQPGQPGARSPEDRPAARDPSRAGAAGQGSRSDALWAQLAEKHEQLVKMKAGGPEAGEGQPGRQPRGAQPGGAQPGQPGGAEAGQPGGAGAGQPGGAQPGQPGGLQPRQPGRQPGAGADAEDSPTARLEREIGDLYLQILKVDIAEAQGERGVARPEELDETPNRPRPQAPPRRQPGTPPNDN